MTKKTTKKTTQRPLLHYLLVSLSYNGTIARSLLAVIYFACLLLVATMTAASLTTASIWQPIQNGLGSFVIVSLLFFAYDAIYVTIAKLYKLPRLADVILCFGIELGFLIFVFLPLFTTTDTYLNPALGIILMFSPVFVLCARTLIGVWMNQAHKKRA